MTRRQHRVEPRERVEAVEPELRLAGQALDRRASEAVLKVLAEQQLVALERSRDRQPRLELVDEREALAESRHEVVGLEDPVVGAALGAHLRHAGGEAAVLRCEGIRQHLDRFHGAARQLEVEVAGGRVVEAGAAHLQRAGRGGAALDAQPALGTADDAREHRQQRLKIVARERLDIHLRAGQHVADRHRLQALGRRVGRNDDLDALADERQSHLDEHLLCLAAPHGERRRLAVGKPLADCLHDIAAGWHVGKRDLADRVADRARDRDVAVGVT